MYDDAARTYIPDTFDCVGYETPTGSPPGDRPIECGGGATYDPETRGCRYPGGGSYDSSLGPPGNGCPSGQYWEGNGSPISWRCVNWTNYSVLTGPPPPCPSGFNWVTGGVKNGVNYSSGCWPGSGGGSTSPYPSSPYPSPSYTYSPPTYTSSYAPYCGPTPFTDSADWYQRPTTCPSGQYPNWSCPTKARVAKDEEAAKQYNQTYNYANSYPYCPNPPAK